MTEQGAIGIADTYAREKGSELNREVFVQRRRRLFRRTFFWHIVSNVGKKPAIGSSELMTPRARYSAHPSQESNTPANTGLHWTRR